MVVHFTYKYYLYKDGKNIQTVSLKDSLRSVSFDKDSFNKKGYTLDGFYSSSSNESKYFTISKNLIVSIYDRPPTPGNVYARYSPNEYTVTFNKNGGSGGDSSKTVTYGSSFGSFSAPTQTGYKFKGYNSSDGVQYVNSDGDGIKNHDLENRTLYAQLEPITYTVRFMPGEGSGNNQTQTLTSDTSANLNAFSGMGFSKEGYTFSHWSGNGTTYKDQAKVENLASTSTTLDFVAKWKANDYVLTYDPNGGDGNIVKQTCTFDSTITLTKNSYVKNGSLFLGWSTTKNGEVEFKDEATYKYIVPNNLTLYVI